jgi:CheY-like chemotaxis protein
MDRPFRVLLVDRDEDIADVVRAVLTDEGYAVSVVAETTHEAIAAAVGIQEPDCVLLDGAGVTGYDTSWTEAAYLAARERTVPTVMFTAHGADVSTARDRTRCFSCTGGSASASISSGATPGTRGSSRSDSSTSARPRSRPRSPD